MITEKKNLHILIIGAGSTIPSFIKRRIEQYDNMGIFQTVYKTKQSQIKYLTNANVFFEPKGLIDKFFQTAKILLSIVVNPLAFYNLLRINDVGGKKQKLSVKLLLKKYSFCNIQRPDIIHVQWLSATIDYAWLKKLYKAPLVSSARGSDLTVFAHHDEEHTARIRACIKEADYIHCVSKSIAERCIFFGAKPEQIFINYNGIDLKVFRPSLSIKNKNPFTTIISVGSLISRKGYIYQLLALKSLLEKGYKIYLWIIGNGEEKKVLLYQASRLGIDKYVKFWGNQPENKIIELLDKSDIYVSTSYAEGLSNSVMEAAAMALPVVAFECEGMSEIINNDQTGYIIDYGNIDLLINRLTILIDDSELRLRFGKNARKKMELEFDSKIHVKKMIDFFHHISSNER